MSEPEIAQTVIVGLAVVMVLALLGVPGLVAWVVGGAVTVVVARR